MRSALDKLDHPDRSFATVLILGTNGKGSTAALLSSILSCHGLRVGFFSSPHLVRVEERIRIAGEIISDGRLLAILDELESFPALSYFETLTVAALLEFARRGVDIAVLEAGLGGRWDAANAVAPAISLLTNVGTDHQSWLGTTREAIAAEKAAALRGHEAIVGSWDGEVEGAIRENSEAGTPLSLASEWATIVPGASGNVLFTAAELCGTARLPLYGGHQRANLQLALAGATALARHGLMPPLEAGRVSRGIEATRWPGRLQWVLLDGRRLLLDGAHNREATEVLATALDDLRLGGRIHLLFSSLDDKPLEAMAALLLPRVAEVAVVPLACPRATPLDRLVAAFPGCRHAPTVAAGLASLSEDGPVLVTGSLRLVGEALGLANGNGHG